MEVIQILEAKQFAVQDGKKEILMDFPLLENFLDFQSDIPKYNKLFGYKIYF